jgi:hypothetical protein
VRQIGARTIGDADDARVEESDWIRTTVIRNARTVVAWDAASGPRAYLSDADVAFADGRTMKLTAAICGRRCGAGRGASVGRKRHFGHDERQANSPNRIPFRIAGRHGSFVD